MKAGPDKWTRGPSGQSPDREAPALSASVQFAPYFILLRLNPLGQRKLPIVISLSRMLCFGRVCASPCALNVSAALQGAYITPFPTEVVRAIRAQRGEAYVLKIVCYLHSMASNPHPSPWRAPHKCCSAGCLHLDSRGRVRLQNLLADWILGLYCVTIARQ